MLAIVAVLALVTGAAAITETIVDNFDGAYTTIAGVGDVANGWSYWTLMAGDDTYVDGSGEIRSGGDGIADTTAAGDDVQVIPVGQGLPDSICITAGDNAVIDTTPSNDDWVDGVVIRTGPDGVCDTDNDGDDESVLDEGEGQPNAVIITAGTNAVIESSPTQDDPDVWADDDTGYGGSGQEFGCYDGVRGTVATFPVVSGTDYMFAAKMFMARLDGGGLFGRTDSPGGQCAWGVDLTGQTDDPDAGTIIWYELRGMDQYNDPEAQGAGWASLETNREWQHTAISAEATGNTVSVWLVADCDPGEYYASRGMRVIFDELAITQITKDPTNLLYNGNMEDFGPVDTAIPYGWQMRQHKCGARTGGVSQFLGLCDSDNTLANNGRDILEGGQACHFAKTDKNIVAQTGLHQVVTGLKEDTDYRFRCDLYIWVKDVDPQDLGPQADMRFIFNDDGDVDGSTSEVFSSYSRPAIEDEQVYQDIGHYKMEYTFDTQHRNPGTNDEVALVGVRYWQGWPEAHVFLDNVSLTEVGPAEKSAANSLIEIQEPLHDDYLAGETINTGTQGICDTVAVGDDVQVIPEGQGEPNTVCVVAGDNGIIDTSPGNDDWLDVDVIRTGPDGICDSTATGDDHNVIDPSIAAAHTTCITAGTNGIIDTCVRDSGVVGTTVTISWQTDVPSTSQAEYGTTETLGSSTVLDPTLTTSHVVAIAGVDPAQDLFYRVTSTAAGYVPDISQQNRILSTNASFTNGDFEGGFGASVPERGVTPTGWRHWWGAMRKGDTDVGQSPAPAAHGGSHMLAMTEAVNWDDEDGGVLQKIAATPGKTYEVETWVRAHDARIAYSGTQGQNIGTQVGIDPTGGTDPHASSVVWSAMNWYGNSDDETVVALGGALPYGACISGGGNGTVETTPAGDDTVGQMITGGANYMIDSTPAGDDQKVSFFGLNYIDIIVAGSNGVLDTVPTGDDVIDPCITPGPDGLCDTTAAGDDLQEVSVGLGTMYAPVILAGPNGVLESNAGGDDTQLTDYIDAGADGICDSEVRNPVGGDRRVNDLWYTESVEAEAQAGTITVFLRGWFQYMSLILDDSHYVYWDDVTVTELAPPSLTWDSAQAGWNLMSLPIDPADPDPAVVFADLATCGNVIGTNLYRYSKTSGYELYPTQFTAMETGRAYWLRLTSVCDNTVSGTLLSAPQSIALDDGWNMFGMPLSTPVLWSGCQITDGVETKSIADAGTAGWIQTLIYYYTPAGYKSVKPDGTGDDDSLRAWVGYWFLTYQPGLSLIVQ